VSSNIILFEELSMHAHPVIRTQMYDGWVLRFANGYTNRANSVYPLYPSAIALEKKIAYCEDVYASQGLPTVFKLTPASPQGLDRLLERYGYETVTPTNLMTKVLTTDVSSSRTIVSPNINPIWQENYFRLFGIIDEREVATAAIIQGNIQNKVLCGLIKEDDEVVACGLCVVEREYAGLYGVVADSSFRNRGYGYDVCTSLLNAAMNIGAKTAYLQVMTDNTPAIALYTKLGFQDSYQYWYRRKKI